MQIFRNYFVLETVFIENLDIYYTETYETRIKTNKIYRQSYKYSW
jgi:hypothetical protein